MTTAPVRPFYGPDGQALNGVPHAVQPFRAGEWQLISPPQAMEKRVRPAAVPDEKPDIENMQPEPVRDLVAEAEAEAIRSRAWAEAEARRIAAEADAKAVEIKAVEEVERQRIANERARMKLEKDQATHTTYLADNDAKIAEARTRQEAAEREQREAREKTESVQQTAAEAAEKVEKSANSWRRAAIVFAVVCAIVALPVQMHAFYKPSELWLLAAPVMLEGGAWVVQRGARAAIDEGRPYWHYRLIAWTQAFISAAINFSHGIMHFDLATAIGTAFASLAGPGVWDLHEHGRIRLRDGKLTRAQRRQKVREEKRVAAEEAAEEKRRAAEKEAAEKAAAEAAEKLVTERAEHFPKVWEHAVKLAAALGETTVTEGVWKRAYKDIEGTEPFESVDIIRTRNAAERRAAAARSETPGNTPSKVTNTQRVPHLPAGSGRGSKTGPAVRGIRRKGDSQQFVNAARKQAAITAKQAVNNESKEG